MVNVITDMKDKLHKIIYCNSWTGYQRNRKTEQKNMQRENTDFGPWIRRARSLVIFPDSTVSTQADSSFRTKSKSLVMFVKLCSANKPISRSSKKNP